MNSGYTPLFSSIITSSIWNEDIYTRICWVTMLALSSPDGIVEGSIPGIAVVARVTTEECEKAIEKLKAPDKYSRTTENEGRRIVDIPGGWKIINYTKFREKARSRAAYLSEWRKKKKKQKENIKHTHTHTHTQKQSDTQVKQGETVSTVSLEKQKYLDFVYLSENEHKKLIEKFGEKLANEKIENLNHYIGSKGKKYDSHYHTILAWERKNEREQKPVSTYTPDPVATAIREQAIKGAKHES